MGRKFIDCREYPSEMNCTLALSADNEDELLEAAVQHAITVHGHEDTPDLRTMIRTAMRDGTPPVEAPRRAARRRPAGCMLKAPERRFLLVRWRHFGRDQLSGYTELSELSEPSRTIAEQSAGVRAASAKRGRS